MSDAAHGRALYFRACLLAYLWSLTARCWRTSFQEQLCIVGFIIVWGGVK